MSEYEFILGQVVRVIRASDLDDLAKQILIINITEKFEQTQEYIETKRNTEHQKQFIKREDD